MLAPKSEQSTIARRAVGEGRDFLANSDSAGSIERSLSGRESTSASASKTSEARVKHCGGKATSCLNQRILWERSAVCGAYDRDSGMETARQLSGTASHWRENARHLPGNARELPVSSRELPGTARSVIGTPSSVLNTARQVLGTPPQVPGTRPQVLGRTPQVAGNRPR